MTTRQMKPRMLSEYDLWSQSQAFKKAWDSDSIERKNKLAIREGGRCGFCGYTPEKQTEHIKGKRLRQLTKRELLYRHMKNHMREAREYGNYQGDRTWQHPPGFNHRGRIKPKEGKP